MQGEIEEGGATHNVLLDQGYQHQGEIEEGGATLFA